MSWERLGQDRLDAVLATDLAQRTLPPGLHRRALSPATLVSHVPPALCVNQPSSEA